MRINVVHAVSHTSSQFDKDADGFTAAMEVVAREHQVDWLNVHPYNVDHRLQESRIPDCDFVLVRSDWLWLPAQSADHALRGTDLPVGLLIAGSTPPPPLAEQLRFDVLFYETPWYERFVSAHPFAIEAFGVDTRWMHDRGRADRRIDWLFVGRLAPFKRPERLLGKHGVRVAIGDLSVHRPIEDELRADGVEVLDMVTHDALADLYNDAKAVLVPCELQGGGERAVLEGRACGCAVEIAEDNPKLRSLLDAPIRSHVDYGQRLLSAIEEVVAGRRLPSELKLRGQRARRRSVLIDKARRSPSTIVIRARGLARRLR